MRTKILQKFLRETSEINRYVTLALFVNTQFFEDHEKSLQTDSGLMTSEAFPENEFRDQYNVRLEEVREDKQYYERFLFSTSFVFIYSAFRIYSKSLFKFAGDVKGDELEDQKDSKLKSLFDEVGDGLREEMGAEIFATLKYIRHLRNRHVHGEGKPSQGMRNIIRREGQALNNYWEGELDGKLQRLDFSDLATETIDLWELIDYIRVIRRIAEEIDRKILSILEKEQIIEHVARIFEHEFQDDIKSLTEDRVESKFAGFAAQELGISRDEVKEMAVDIPGM